jgi:hypothetical protein
MAKGKCWIYKRATLHLPDLPPQILDYSDGTEEFDCDDVFLTPGEHPVYMWNLPGEIVPIPLNVPRSQVDSIIRSGTIPYNGGDLQWEFIFGKYRTYGDYYMKKTIECLPFIIIICVLIVLLKRKNNVLIR